jgi:hypothetical protein
VAGEAGVGRRVLGLGMQEVAERAQGGQPPVDGGHGMAELAAVVDIGVYVVEGDGGRGICRPRRRRALGRWCSGPGWWHAGFCGAATSRSVRRGGT